MKLCLLTPDWHSEWGRKNFKSLERISQNFIAQELYASTHSFPGCPKYMVFRVFTGRRRTKKKTNAKSATWKLSTSVKMQKTQSIADAGHKFTSIF